MNFLKQIAANHAKSEYYQDDAVFPIDVQSTVRLIAYFLPQFHPIPENDTWWGKGFTEWTNVTKGLPRFKGHYQPHLPADLGFYDLRLPQVLRQQAEMVRNHGLSGLCFHHYWFNGKALLDTPIQLLLEHQNIELSFCINWANENWSRRWDGNDQEILMSQTYSPEDDIAFATSLEPLFRDPRYIQINGRPLLMLYRPKLLPDAAATVRRWRGHFESVGLVNPYVVMAQGFGDDDPRPYGIDAAAGFPPHRSGLDSPIIQDSLEYLDDNFHGTVVRYADMVAAALANQPSDFRFFPGVCPSWDNEARKPGRGFCVHGATPAAYHDWLAAACKNVLVNTDPDERIVFINAWNEWAEGAHLEPDRHFGYAFLNETSRVVATLAGLSPEKLQRRADEEAIPIVRQSRRVRDLPSIIVKNLLFHAANTAEFAAKRLRKLVSGL